MSLELVNQWVKMIFAVLLGLSFWLVFDSMYLAIMTWTFLFFFPSANKEIERSASSGILHIGMALILFFAFNTSESMGLGLNIVIGEGVAGGFGTILIYILLLGIVLRGIMSIARRGTGGEERSTIWMVDVLIYISIVVIFILLEVWTWEASAIIFVGIWIMAFISGSAGDPDSRQTIGVILIIASFVIFSTGIGTQAVGSAMFGQWFPTVYQGLSSVTGPLGEAFSGLTSGFGNVFQLVTDPTGYAQSIINGSYQKDPETGLTGAYGVELSELSITTLYPEQPFSAQIKVQNKGAYSASNVKVGLELGDKAPAGSDLETLGFDQTSYKCDASKESCWKLVDDQKTNKLNKIDIRQLFFQSSGISCKNVVNFNLKEKFLPLRATVEYDYSVDSTIDLEFISKEEWDRLVYAGTLQTQIKKAAQFKNAPVQLNMDTLEQPVREGTDHFLGVNLVPSKSNGDILDIDNITLEVPKDLEIISCLPQENDIKDTTTSKVYDWVASDFTGGDYLIFCNLKAIDFEDIGLSGSPYQTFVIKSSAYYRFKQSKDFVPGAFNFGGITCCKKDDDCSAKQQTCNNQNKCGLAGTIEEQLKLLDIEITKVENEVINYVKSKTTEFVNQMISENIIGPEITEWTATRDEIQGYINEVQSVNAVKVEDIETKKIFIESFTKLKTICQVYIDYLNEADFYYTHNINPELYQTEINQEITNLEQKISDYKNEWGSDTSVSSIIPMLDSALESIKGLVST